LGQPGDVVNNATLVIDRTGRDLHGFRQQQLGDGRPSPEARRPGTYTVLTLTGNQKKKKKKQKKKNTYSGNEPQSLWGPRCSPARGGPLSFTGGVCSGPARLNLQ